MHYHCEIIMPPTDNVVGAVEAAMNKFSEHGHDGSEDEDFNTQYGFWDFYMIGGRFAGKKLMASFDQTKIDEFYKWLDDEQVTVSSFQAGKQEISPSDQIPKIDAKWNEMFPTDTFLPCPIFNHSNDQYCKDVECTLPKDIATLAETPLTMECGRVIFCRPGDEYGALRAEFMLTDTAWNGCNNMRIQWDGTFGGALKQYQENLEHMAESFKAKVTPQDNWLVVTVDYHS